MIDETKPTEKKPAPTATKPPEPNRVKRLQFNSKQLDVPGLSLVGGATEREGLTIEFLPWLRHFRFTFVGPGKAPAVRYVHEVHTASWDPA
jgi:hypothetical protein